FFHDSTPTLIYPLSLHDALPISVQLPARARPRRLAGNLLPVAHPGHPVHSLTHHLEPLMSQRALNRATLARQHLLGRGELSPEAAVEAVGALQAQYAPAPPVALWSRVCAFRMEEYVSALRERRLVTGLLMRGTLHVVSAAEYWPIAAAVASVQA